MRFFSEKKEYILIILIIIMVYVIFRIPCIFHPFSCHDCYEWGYKYSTGEFPDSVHEKMKFNHKFN